LLEDDEGCFAILSRVVAFFVFFGAFGCAISLLALAILFLSSIESGVALGIFGWLFCVCAVMLLIGFVTERSAD
jgi:hypothetical protein